MLKYDVPLVFVIMYFNVSSYQLDCWSVHRVQVGRRNTALVWKNYITEKRFISQLYADNITT